LLNRYKRSLHRQKKSTPGGAKSIDGEAGKQGDVLFASFLLFSNTRGKQGDVLFASFLLFSNTQEKRPFCHNSS
jgi:hypothetical protein